MKEYSIASIAGDGIGKEVVPEAQNILNEIIILHLAIIMKNTEK